MGDKKKSMKRLKEESSDETQRQLKKAKTDTPLAFHEGPALRFSLWSVDGRARRGTLELPHAVVETPTFMPVGTHGTIKMIPSELMSLLGPRLILGNTYHLGSAPGVQVLKEAGGLHKFMNWPHALLTDSGGFQMVSLSSLSEITDTGVEFEHPETKEKLMLTPEKSMEIQEAIGADVAMALDDVVSVVEPSKERLEVALHRTTAWLKRCFAAHPSQSKQNIWPIVQGGLIDDFRKISIKALVEAGPAHGYAIGGLSGGEAKSDFWRVVELCTRPGVGLPQDRSRYLMGVGYTVDLVVCVALGCDLFDCVYPTRTARFGTALTDEGMMRLKKSKYATCLDPIDSTCTCYTCKNFTCSYLHYGMSQTSILTLLTIHNIYYMNNFMVRIREAIRANKFSSFVHAFLLKQFSTNPVPGWVADALSAAGLPIKTEWTSLTFDYTSTQVCGFTPHHVPHKSSTKKSEKKISSKKCQQLTSSNLVMQPSKQRSLRRLLIIFQRQ
eukprot:Blabericola_migrator_1__13376@NODE_94_length_14457_cov_129_345379_g84_i0_p4_GENE_NODE_94_length_14457_cov_129_345379_g84_i0NODE_94_length_14457_cov_129_345379_g84_i0_p4_ORF_typecomplete_len498_score98_47TGT/PF01702_18/4e122_NODE_94_length_14457_cov_129_345379_g84_i056977190